MVSEEYEKLEQENSSINLKEFGLLLFTKWHWFLFALLLSLGVAMFKILTTTPLYTRTTSLLFKDEQKNGISISREFIDLGIVDNRSNMANEIQMLKAPVLMEDVVQRLNLSTEVTTTDRLHERPLYNDAPIILTLGADINAQADFSFKIKPQKTGKSEAYNFISQGQDLEKEISVPFNTWIKTPVGTLRIDTTSMYSEKWYGRELFVRKYPSAALSRVYARRLAVTQEDEEATILQLTLVDEIPARADDILLTLIDVYDDYWKKDKDQVAETTADFITERLNMLSKELGDVDRDIADYKSHNMLPDIKSAATMQLAQSDRNRTEILALGNQLGMAQYIESYLNKNSGIGQLLPANTLGQTSIEKLISAYNDMTLQRNELLANSSEDNTFVQNLDAQLRVQRSAILRSLHNLIAQIKTQMSNVQHSEEEINQKIKASPRQAKQLLSNERQQKVKESLYIYLLQKREESELSKAYTSSNTLIIQPPTGSTVPTAPHKARILLFALMVGFIIPALFFYLREYLNNRVRGRKDLEGLSVPLIGEIPTIDDKHHWWLKKTTQPRQIHVKAGNRDIINEAFRLVRTKLNFHLDSEENNKVIMLTSFNPGSGKTFVTANLGKAISLKDKKVLIIDMDIRRRSLSNMLPKKADVGLTSYLAGENISLSELIVHAPFGAGLDVLPAGIIPPNPTELLHSEQMVRFFTEVRAIYDYILLDCPPVEVVADATIIKDYADCTIFVVRTGLMERRMLKDIDKLYEDKMYNNMVLLLNGTDLSSSSYGKYRYTYR